MRITLDSSGDLLRAALGAGRLSGGETRVLVRVLETSTGGRSVLDVAGARVEAVLPFAASRGDGFEALLSFTADRVLLEILGERSGSPPAAATVPQALEPARAAAPQEVLDSLGLPDTPAARAAVEALVAERLPLGRELVAEVAAALAELIQAPDAAGARAVARLIAEGLPASPSTVSAASPGTADLAALAAEAASALGALAARDPALKAQAASLAALFVDAGDASALREAAGASAAKLLAVLDAIESRAAEAMAGSERLGSLDRLVELLSERPAQVSALAPRAAEVRLDALVTADGRLSPGAEGIVASLDSSARDRVLAEALAAEKKELARLSLSPDLSRAARSVRQMLSRAALSRTASADEGSAGFFAVEIPVSDGSERAVVRVRVRRGRGQGGSAPDGERAVRFAIGITMSALGPVLAELSLRRSSLTGSLRLSTDEAASAVESRLDELEGRLRERGFVPSITVESLPAPGADGDSGSLWGEPGELPGELRSLDIRI